MAIDVGYWFSSKAECQNAADAAALAGASKMLTWDSAFKVLGVDPSAAFAEAQTFALSNQNNGTNLNIRPNDCTMGWWDFDTRSMDPSRTYPLSASGVDPDDVTAFKVQVRRDNTLNLPISSFFAPIFGIDEVAINVSAAAYLGYAGNVAVGDVELPIAVLADAVGDGSSGEFVPRCGSVLSFRSENTETAEWTTFFDWPTNDRTVKSYVKGDKLPPALDATTGDVLNVINGNLSNNTFRALQDRFDANKDPSTGTWTTWLPVVLPGHSATKSTLVGFVQFEISGVYTAPAKEVRGNMKCDSILPYSRGGGGNFGVRAGIPVLVD
ncbi:hypothetical protein FAK_07370 [Desulfoferula mesophila]|uniref:DUF2134 domain-containing protein n=2 Tax=Desulfoferula mesophila TaxID=3058419 RepID=A0AAU9ESW8_9BACT|nr:hypothetical protein FAK_07370 [Desulfoferula mesophilus]